VAQTVNTNSEKLESSAQEMDEKAKMLLEMVNEFKIKENIP